MTSQITIAYGDGIGHDIMDAALLVMREAGAMLDVEILQMGEESYRLGDACGFDSRCLRSVARCGVLLKAPTIDPKLIAGLEQETLFSASEALYAAFELSTHETTFIHNNTPAFTAISSIGEKVAIFETALEFNSESTNPVGMILAATHMLNHIGQVEIAQNIGAALLSTLESGASSSYAADFAAAVVAKL